MSALRDFLSQITIPHTDIVVSRCARVLESDDQATVTVDLGMPAQRVADAIVNELTSVLSDAGFTVKVVVEQLIPSIQPANSKGRIDGVKNIIAIASGKGGVGKSTTAVNLALALSQAGATVGMLDADIYGPSQSHMLGVADKRPDVQNNNTIMPIHAHGIQMISMGNLVNENTPMVWRGPMASGALQQLLQKTAWQEVDYLIVDMPPGTGDIQLTLSQSVPVSGSVIVTTPQDIALLDAKKGIEMFRKVDIPVYGVIENMSLHTCTQCGHEDAIFGKAGGERLATEFQTSLLGRLPLVMSICEQVDAGCPTVVSHPESKEALAYADIARELALALWKQSLEETTVPIFSVDDD